MRYHLCVPERITPKHDFGPCVLNRASIEQIAEILTSEFDALFKGQDGIWEVYDEPRDGFLAAIRSRRRLDLFEARALMKDHEFGVTLSFNATEAEVRCNLPPVWQNRLEHLIHDVHKCLLPPTFFQRIALIMRDGRWSAAASMISAVARMSIEYVTAPSTGPYAQIILEKQPPNPMWENVKANLLSNVIWAMLGASALFLAQLLAKKFGWMPFWK